MHVCENLKTKISNAEDIDNLISFLEGTIYVQKV